MKNKLLLSFTLVILFSSCSKLPKKIVPQAKLNADQTLILAQRTEYQFENAALLFKSAWQQYRTMADIEGQLSALSGLGRVALQQSDLLAYHHYLQSMQDLVDTIDSTKSYHPVILELNRLHREKKWQELVEFTRIESFYPRTAKMQILAFQIQANTYLRNVNKSDINRLTSWQKKYARRLTNRRYSHPQIVANASYTLAFYHYSERNIERAKHFVHEAKKIDYQYGFFYNYAFDLWLEANIAIQTKAFYQAEILLHQAKIIFQEYHDESMVKKIEKNLIQIREENK
jgi:hypothetical protein